MGKFCLNLIETIINIKIEMIYLLIKTTKSLLVYNLNENEKCLISLLCEEIILLGVHTDCVSQSVVVIRNVSCFPVFNVVFRMNENILPYALSAFPLMIAFTTQATNSLARHCKTSVL